MFSSVRQPLIRSAMAVLALSIGTVANAQIQNGGFEDATPFNNWTTLGFTAVVDSTFGITAPGPTHAGLAGTDNFNDPPHPASPAAIEAFLGLAPGSLNGVGNGAVAEGSAFKQTFTVAAGDTLAFHWNFLTNEFSGDPTRDFAFFTLDDGTGAVLTLLADIDDSGLGLTGPPLDVSYGFETGFLTASHNFASAGTYTLGFGVVDVEGIDVSSALAVDLVALRQGAGTAVPEPGVLAAIPALGLSAAGFLRRRR